MIELSAIILRLPDSRIVLQRRSKEAWFSPNLLGLFGGHLDDNEDPQDGAIRELEEETSLRAADLKVKFLGTFIIDAAKLRLKEDHLVHVFELDIPDSNFDVYEGDRSEVYTVDEALKRDDISTDTFLVLNKYLGKS